MSDEVVERVARALTLENSMIALEYGSGNCPADTAYERLARAALSALHGEDMREKIARVIEETPDPGLAASAIMALIGGEAT